MMSGGDAADEWGNRQNRKSCYAIRTAYTERKKIAPLILLIDGAID